MTPLFLAALASLPAGFVIRTNIPDLKNHVVHVGDTLTLPGATREADFWLTVRYYDTCAEETHINSRAAEAVAVKIERIPDGECDDRMWR